MGKPVTAVVLALGMVAIALAALGLSPGAVFAALLSGAFGDYFAVTDSLVKAMPLIFTGLSISVAFSAAQWNIGADGQLLMGAMAACAVGIHLQGFPRPFAIAIVLAAGAAAGAVWSGACGLLKVRFAVSEVISTIMLDYVAVQAVSWAVHGPLMEPSHALPVSAPLAPSARLWGILPPSQLSAGLPIALFLAAICYVWMFHTPSGFELRAFGKSPRAGAFFGIGAGRVTVLAMTLSGALAGLGGAVQLAGVTNRLYETFSPGWGYEAIAVALVARLNPLAIVLTAAFFGALDNGSQAIQRNLGISPVLVQVIQAVVILLLLAFDTPVLRRAGAREASAKTLEAIVDA